MRPFKTVAVVQGPVDALYAFMRDRLPELAPDLDDIRSIRVLQRREKPDGTVHLVNEWRAKAALPSALNGIIRADDLGWIDRAAYASKNTMCQWQIEPLFLREHIRCTGTTTYEAAMGGRGARVTFEGRFELDPAAVQRHVRVLHEPITRVVESIVTTLIPRNFRRMIEAAARRVR